MLSISIMAMSAIIIVGVIGMITLILKSYKICPNDKIMIIYGMSKKKKNDGLPNVKYIHGGGALVIPFFQKAVYMSLKPKTIDVPLSGALTNNSIRVDVPAQFTIRIGYQEAETLQNAVYNLLESTSEEIEETCSEIILGSLREVVSSMDIEELISDREKFTGLIDKNTNRELKKIGLEIVNVNIRDIQDESGYIQAIGQKASSGAIERAKIDVAEQEKSGAIGVAENIREQEVTVQTAESSKQIGIAEQIKNERVKTAEYQALQVSGENESKANIEASNSELGIKTATYNRNKSVAEAEAEREVYEKQQVTRKAEIEKDTIPQAEVSKRELEIEASADAEQVRIKAQGDADAYKMDADAKAHGIKVEFEAKAKGFKDLVDAAGGDPVSAIQYLLVEKAEELARIQVEAMKSIDFSNITFWGGSNDGGNSMGNVLNDLMTSTAPLHGLMGQKGVALPDWMGKLAKDVIEAESTEKEKKDEDKKEDE